MTTTELITLEPQQIPALLGDDAKMEAIIAEIENAAKSEAPDLTTTKGRNRIKSIAYKVAQTKAPVKSHADHMLADAKAKIAAITKRRQTFETRMDALRDEVKKPVVEWEQAEEKRVDAIKAKIAVIKDVIPMLSSDGIQEQIDNLAAREFAKADYAEYLGLALETRDLTVSRLRELKQAAIAREEQEAKAADERAELELLRKQQAEADKKAAELQAQLDEANERAQLAEEKAKPKPEPVEDEIVYQSPPIIKYTKPDAREEAIKAYVQMGFSENAAATIIAHIIAGRIPHVTFTE